MRTWNAIKQYEEILFESYNGIAKITINRPRYRNAFTPLTVAEISDALRYCREAQDIGVVVLTGAGDKGFPLSTCSMCRNKSALCRNLSLPWSTVLR